MVGSRRGNLPNLHDPLRQRHSHRTEPTAPDPPPPAPSPEATRGFARLPARAPGGLDHVRWSRRVSRGGTEMLNEPLPPSFSGSRPFLQNYELISGRQWGCARGCEEDLHRKLGGKVFFLLFPFYFFFLFFFFLLFIYFLNLKHSSRAACHPTAC